MSSNHSSARSVQVCPGRQRGLTLIEFMVSIALGMIMVAALATLIADQSSNRAEVDRAGRLIENGRYAIRLVTEDIQMAGYLGELYKLPAVQTLTPDPTTPGLPDTWVSPCDVGVANLGTHIGQHVLGLEIPGATARAGYNGTTALPGGMVLSCLANIKAGTDAIVVRRVDPDSSAYETTPGIPDPAKLESAASPVNNTRLFMQGGLLEPTDRFEYRINTGANQADFILQRKDKSKAPVRRVLVRIYYVTTCSVCTGSNRDKIPSLKMLELGAGAAVPAWSDPITIAEGIENMQVEWGLDNAPVDGSPDGADVAASAVALANWPKAVSAKIYLVSRSIELTPGHDDTKSYPLGLAGTLVPLAVDANDVEERRYKRHVFVQSVRFVNPSARRGL